MNYIRKQLIILSNIWITRIFFNQNEKRGLFLLMGLNHDQFLLVEQGVKTIEIRLNDPKRSLLKIDSSITFKDLKTQKELSVSVNKIYKFKTFLHFGR